MITDPTLIDGMIKMRIHPKDFSMSGGLSMRGPCINCGGRRRMVIFLNGEFPKWFLRCDQCEVNGYVPHLYKDISWPDGPIGDLPPPEPKDYSRALEILKNEKVDELFHSNLDEKSRKWWRDAGIPDAEQDFYKLGIVHGRPFKKYQDEGLMVLDAYTIPKYELGWELRNIDFRMIDAPSMEGKYRPFPGCPSAPFISRPDSGSLTNSNGVAFVVEGSKKAMVTSIYLGGAQVVGVPSSNSWAGAPERFIDAEIIYVLLDADAWLWGRRMTKMIGPRARQVTLPMKIDDGFLRGTLTEESFETALRYARREVGP